MPSSPSINETAERTATTSLKPSYISSLTKNHPFFLEYPDQFSVFPKHLPGIFYQEYGCYCQLRFTADDPIFPFPNHPMDDPAPFFRQVCSHLYRLLSMIDFAKKYNTFCHLWQVVFLIAEKISASVLR
jgi:hypothetical protein